jgi:hypothetical protein
MKLTEPYKPRAISFLEHFAHEGWRMKVYGIAYQAPAPADSLVASAKEFARKTLPGPAVCSSRYGVGFLGVHEGRGENFIFVDWWENENELCHHVFISPTKDPKNFRIGHTQGTLGCVWDIRVISFERNSWLKHVLAEKGTPDLESYLADTLTEVV